VRRQAGVFTDLISTIQARRDPSERPAPREPREPRQHTPQFLQRTTAPQWRQGAMTNSTIDKTKESRRNSAGLTPGAIV
jgi:hypothetical protein